MSARPEHRIIKRRTADRPPLIFFLKQFKKRLFIVLYEIPDIRSALLDDGVPLGFQLYFLRFRAAGYLGFSSPFAFMVRQYGVSSVERWKLAQAQMDTKIPAVMGSVKSA